MSSTSRRALLTSTPENTDPKPNPEISALRDEIALLSIDFNQTVQALNERIEQLAKELEQTKTELKQMEKKLNLEIEYVISSLVSEIIYFVDRQTIDKKRKHEDFDENIVQIKKCRPCD